MKLRRKSKSKSKSIDINTTDDEGFESAAAQNINNGAPLAKAEDLDAPEAAETVIVDSEVENVDGVEKHETEAAKETSQSKEMTVSSFN